MCCLLSLFHAKNEFKLILFNCSRCWNVKSSMNDPFNLKGTENDTENRDRSDCWKIGRLTVYIHSIISAISKVNAFQ